MSSPLQPEDLLVLARLLTARDIRSEPPTKAQIARLQTHGCEIEQTGVSEFQLTRVPIELWKDYLEWSFAGSDLLGPINWHVYRETASTQDVAKRLGPGRAVVLADHQSAGRGRLGRKWESSPGESVLMSLRWPATDQSVSHDRVSLMTGLAVSRITEQLLPEKRVRLKWPNDVVVDGRKIAGILIEAEPTAYIIGIGLNVTASPDLEIDTNTPTTNLKEEGATLDRLAFIERLVLELSLKLQSNHEHLESWRPRAAIGTTQTFEHNSQRITGEVLDLDPNHGLIVRRDTGEIITLPAATTSVVK